MARVLIVTLVTRVTFVVVMIPVTFVCFVTCMITTGIVSPCRRSGRRRRTVVPMIHTGMRVSHDDSLLLPT